MGNTREIPSSHWGPSWIPRIPNEIPHSTPWKIPISPYEYWKILKNHQLDQSLPQLEMVIILWQCQSWSYHICGSSFLRNGTILLELLASVHDFGTFAAYGGAAAGGTASFHKWRYPHSWMVLQGKIRWKRGFFFFSGCPPILGNLRRRMGHISQKMF